MHVAPVRSFEARRVETPNAVMTTLASPTQGLSTALSMWQVEMGGGQRGPVHAFASEQLWHVLDGEAEVAIEGETLALGAGDSLVMPAGVDRQVFARTSARFVVCGLGNAVVSVAGETAPRGVPPWIG